MGAICVVAYCRFEVYSSTFTCVCVCVRSPLFIFVDVFNKIGIAGAKQQVVRKCLYLQPSRDADFSVRTAGVAPAETWKAKRDILPNINI